MKESPKFSVVVVGRNEEKTIPTLLRSLTEFLERGGDVVYVDTGSKDRSAEVAREGGCRVFEEGPRFHYICDEDTAKAINEKFVRGNEGPIINAGDTFFAFDKARNYAMDLAKNDFICTPDCDEAWTTLDIDTLNKLISAGYEKFFVDFVFAHFPDGKPSVEFCADTRFYDRRRIKWKGIIHETMQHDGPLKTARLPREVAYLEHFQNRETDRSRYLAGLAWACHVQPENDRNSHYFARELMYRGKYYSAIEEFKRHIAFNGWPDERGQSMIYLGDCYNYIGDEEKAFEWWHKSCQVGGQRREPFIAMAHYWKRHDKPKLVAAYAAAALEITNNGFYANRVANYTFEPHALMYWAKGWQGKIGEAKKHLLKCLEYHPKDPKFWSDTQYYFTDEEVRDKYIEVYGDPKKWDTSRKIDRIALPITRACNRDCPECSARKADPDWNKEHPHVSMEELEWVGKTLGPIKTIEVTGGEPSIHPDFKEISEKLHEWFECNNITLLTNAVAFESDASMLPILLNYDNIYISHYTGTFAESYGVPSNTSAVKVVEEYLKKNGKSVWVQRIDSHNPIGKPPYRGIPLERYGCYYHHGEFGDSIGYGEGRLYGCCTAYWLSNRGKSIPLTEDWRDHLHEIETPCWSCFLTGERKK